MLFEKKACSYVCFALLRIIQRHFHYTVVLFLAPPPPQINIYIYTTAHALNFQPLTIICRGSGRIRGSIRAVCTIRRIKTKLVGLCVVWHRTRGVAVVLIGAQLAKGSPGAVSRLRAIVVAAVRGRGHRQGRRFLRFVQAVVTV